MAAYERGQERGSGKDSGHMQKLGAARRNLPRVDFDQMNFEERRPPYQDDRGAGDERNEGEPQRAGKRRDDH